jgi:hypothetical protein
MFTIHVPHTHYFDPVSKCVMGINLTPPWTLVQFSGLPPQQLLHILSTRYKKENEKREVLTELGELIGPLRACQCRCFAVNFETKFLPYY